MSVGISDSDGSAVGSKNSDGAAVGSKIPRPDFEKKIII